jgi:hypothetical protein
MGVIAVGLGVSVYGMLCWTLGVVLYKVMGPLPTLPLRLRRIINWKWSGTVKGYFTVRYEIDDDGLWQIVEETETGNRYRVHVRDAQGEMKW